MTTIRATLMTLVAALTLGCDAGPEPLEPGALDPEAGVMDRGFQINGFQINGFQINGFQINGFQINGFQINGFSLEGMALGGLPIDDFQVDGSLISGTVTEDGETAALSGAELIGMTFTIIDESAVDPEESEYTLRVDDVQLDPNDPNGDVYLYLLSFKLGDAQEWSPACADGYGDPVEAIALQNHWDAETGERVDDPDTFTFACRDGAIGKCVAFGYRPWATAGSTSLADYHQACTRMVRADYCGDGVPHTLNGTTIDIADTLNPPIQTFASHWPVEAEWGPDGAVCMTQHLRAKLLGEGVSIPCADALDDLEDCGDAPGGRAELIDRYSDDDD